MHFRGQRAGTQVHSESSAGLHNRLRERFHFKGHLPCPAHPRPHVKRSTLFLTARCVLSVGEGGAAPRRDHPGALAFASVPIGRFNTW